MTDCYFHGPSRRAECEEWKRAVKRWFDDPVGGPYLHIIEDKRIGEVNRRARETVFNPVTARPEESQDHKLETVEEWVNHGVEWYSGDSGVSEDELEEYLNYGVTLAAAIQQRRLQEHQPHAGAAALLARVIEAYDELVEAAVEIDLFPLDSWVEKARQYLIEAE